MWCKKCNREAFDEVCDLCGTTTEQDIPTEIYWCKECRTPIIKLADELGKKTCLIYGNLMSYLSGYCFLNLGGSFFTRSLLQNHP